jgi:4-hydroxybenzoate polyprenyltransferase/phosphoserine phosphatase
VERPYSIDSSVLCVDFDGTLTPCDTLNECIVFVLKRRPWLIFLVAYWLFLGIAEFKSRLANAAMGGLRIDLFPLRPEVVALIETLRAQGKQIVLATATHRALLDPIIAGGMFDQVFATEGGINLKAAAKAECLTRAFPSGFAYIGDSRADLAVWRAAREAFSVGLSSITRRAALAEGLKLRELPLAPSTGTFRLVFSAMRLHQWSKNLLIFVPIALIINNIGWVDVNNFAISFIGFCLLTSGTYLVNDLFDLESDRRHVSKRFRALAAGRLSIPIGIGLGVLLISTGLMCGALVSNTVAGVETTYLALTLLYSFQLKRMAIIDVFTIALLFTLRLGAGAACISTPLSHWLLLFSGFFFTSLALMKRFTEIIALAHNTELPGRGYTSVDRDMILTFGVGFGIGSLIIFSLYVADMTSNGGQYHSPQLLWPSVVLLGFWIMRMWLKASRNEMTDDPIIFALRDRVSIITGAATALCIVVAQVLG